MIERIGRVMLLAALLTGGIGCQAVRAPQASVQSVTVTEQTEEGARVEVVVRVQNPNEVALSVRSAMYEVYVEGVGAFMFTDEPAVTLPPRGEQTMTMPAAFVRSDEPITEQSVRVMGRLRYQPPGQIRELMTEYWIPLPSLPFSQRARLETDGE